MRIWSLPAAYWSRAASIGGAPSLNPVQARVRFNTDRRDAAMLAKLHQSGELTAMRVPDASHEAMLVWLGARDGSS